MIFLENMVEIRGEHGIPHERKQYILYEGGGHWKKGDAQLGISLRILLCEMKKLSVRQGLLAGVSWALPRDEVMIHRRHECSAGNKTSP